MARSVPQGESDSDSVFGNLAIAGMALAGQGGVGRADKSTVGPPGSELCVSDYGAKNHITSDPTNAYDWVDIRPGKEKVLIGSGNEMRVRGVGSLNFKMHAATAFSVESTGVYVTEGIGFNLFSIDCLRGWGRCDTCRTLVRASFTTGESQLLVKRGARHRNQA